MARYTSVTMQQWVLLLAVCTLSGSGVALAGTGLDDIESSGAWAKPAVQHVAQEGVMAGYPNGSFQGNRSATRYELAASLSRLLRQLGEDIARLEASQGSAAEVQALKDSQARLEQELMAVSGAVQSQEARLKESVAKLTEHEARIENLEKVQIHGDMTFGTLSDMGASGPGAGRNGIVDATSTVGRLRLSVDVPVKPNDEDSKLGEGNVHARLVAAFGRYAPIGDHTNSSVDYPFNLYSRIAVDYNAYNEGLATGGTSTGAQGSSIMLRPNVYLESTFYKQRVKSGVPVLTDVPFLSKRGDQWQATGDFYAGVIRWWDLFDVSPYRGNELVQFQNNAFINIPGIAINLAQPMVAWQTHQGLGEHMSADLGVALGSLDVGDAMNGLNLTTEARLNYNTALFSQRFKKAGAVYLGQYNIFMGGNRQLTNLPSFRTLTNRSGGVYPNLTDKGTGVGIYAGWNQEWGRGIGTTIGYGWNNDKPSIIAATTMSPGPARVAGGARQSFHAVVNAPVTAFNTKWRPNDVIGVGYGFSDLHEGGIVGLEDGFEHVTEAYYRLQLSQQLAIVPSVQVVVNRLGVKANGAVTVLGLRLSYSF
jgi:hypothetical protein